MNTMIIIPTTINTIIKIYDWGISKISSPATSHCNQNQSLNVQRERFVGPSISPDWQEGTQI